MAGVRQRVRGRRKTGERALRALAWGCAGTLVLLGFAVLVGWTVGDVRLIAVVPGRVTMKANTALCFLAAGLGLMAELLGDRRWMRVLGGVMLVVGGLTVFEHASGRSLGMDELLFRDALQPQWAGRMAFLTASNFCVGGGALLLLAGGRRRWRWAYGCVVVMLAAALASIVGMLYGVPLLYGAVGSNGVTSMALHTGVGFVVLSVGLFLGERDSRFFRLLVGTEAGSVLTRRALVWVVVLPIALGWVYLRPAMDVGGPKFGLAIFATTLMALGVAGLLALAFMLNREARERAGVERMLRVSAGAVEQSERELRLVTDNLPTLISYLSPEWRFVRVNQTYSAWSGLPPEKIVGRSIGELLGGEYWEATRVERERAAAGIATTFEATYPRSDGMRRVMVTYAPDFSREGDRDGKGMLRGYACMVQDVDEQRKGEAALRQSEKLAVVGRLASSIAHEINNPLESVTNLLYLLGQEADSDGPSAEYVRMAQGELERVSQITVQTLKFHRQTTDAQVCRVSELMKPVVALYGSRLAAAGIALHEEYEREADLRCRDGELRQVLANLVGNAADAMKGGGRLRVRVIEAGRGVVVTVADTGLGMQGETLEKLFEPFFTTKGATGSGLGLWISKEIVERHGGRIGVRSRVGHGTVFRLDLPTDTEVKAAQTVH